MSTLDRPENSDPSSANPVRPASIGFWQTLGWVGAAAFAVFVFTFVFLGTYEAFFGHLPNELRVKQNLTFCTYVVLAIFLIDVVRDAGWNSIDYFALTKPTLRQALVAVIVGASSPALVSIVGILDAAPPDMEMYIEYTKVIAENRVPLFGLNTVFAAAIAEEMIFRGFIYRGWLRTRLGIFWTIVLSAVMFGLAHPQYDLVGMFAAAILGLLFGWLRWWSGSTIVPMLAHATHNGLLTVIIASMD